MTTKDKDILTKDLCCRLPYGIKVEVCIKDKDIKSVDNVKYDTVSTYIRLIDDEKFSVKPYIRPMSSMTDDERDDMREELEWVESFGERFYDKTTEFYDWMNAHHFDYRGLLEKGLAIEAPEGMYDIIR